MTIRIPADAPRRWHLRLADVLARSARVRVASVPSDVKPWPGAVGLLLRLETLIHAIPTPTLSCALPEDALAPYVGRPAGADDLVLDLTAAPVVGEARTVWRLVVDGDDHPDALLAAALAGRAPLVEIRDGGRVVAAGRIGTEYSGVVLASLDDMLARIVGLIADAVAGRRAPLPPVLPTDGGPGLPTGSALLSQGRILRRAGKSLAEQAVRLLYRACTRSPHWRVGWRRSVGSDTYDRMALAADGWQTLSRNPLRFYADPFPIERHGRVTLFVEDFVHAKGKGIISAVEFGPEGPVGLPEPVLELPVHTSYPFVFEALGEAWMIPETCAAGTVELYRATDFPKGWVREAVLIEGVTASDATLVQRDGRWWLLATVRGDGGSFSDSLHLWSAPDFRGPYSPHPANPVLVDIASARPAGRIVERNGSLFRPAQDCRRGYGGALAIARIDQLDAEGFAQTVLTVLKPGREWPGRRLHTLNVAGGFEFVDGSATSPRWRRR